MHVPDGKPSELSRRLDKLRAEEANKSASAALKLLDLVAVQKRTIASLETTVAHQRSLSTARISSATPVANEVTMLRNTLSILLLADGAKEPPTEVKLFAPITPTSKGSFVFDDESARAVNAAFAKLGRDLALDYEHASVFAPFASDPAASGTAAGWFRVTCRPDGCYATSIKWTPKARERILSREYRYASPTFMKDDATNRVTEILGCAITNNPATLNPAPLVLSGATAGAPPALSQAEKGIARMMNVSPEAYLASKVAREAGIPGLTAAERQRELAKIQRFMAPQPRK
jgi:hypothetical protein